MKDFLGNEYDVGDKVLYAAMSGRSVTMVLAEVVSINPKNEGKFTVTVRPLASSRWKQHHGRDYYVDTRTGEKVTHLYSSGNYESPDYWAKLGGYYDDKGNRWKADGSYHHEIIARGYHYESGVLQPYIEQRNDGPKPVTITVTENIVKWNGTTVESHPEWEACK